MCRRSRGHLTSLGSVYLFDALLDRRIETPRSSLLAKESVSGPGCHRGVSFLPFFPGADGLFL